MSSKSGFGRIVWPHTVPIRTRGLQRRTIHTTAAGASIRPLSRKPVTTALQPTQQSGYTAALITNCEELFVESSGYSLEILLAVSAAMAVVGALLGWAVSRRATDDAKKNRELALKLDQVMQDKKAYEDDVVEHFTQTAQMLNGLTESYREVHNHIAQGASSLCQGAGPLPLERAGNNGEAAEIPGKLATTQPPLDYAPKTSPDEKGMLNEEFGFERDASEDQPPKIG